MNKNPLPAAVILLCLGLFGINLAGCGSNSLDLQGKTQEEITAILFQAVEQEDSSLLSQLIVAGVDVNSKDDSGMAPVILAASAGNREIVQQLIDAGADINSQEESEGFTACSMAVFLEDIGMLQFLLELGANPNIMNKQHKTPLFIAAESGQTEIVKILIQAGADPHFINTRAYNQASNTNILIAAVMSDNPETVQLIIDQGVDLNHPDSYGDPALNWAAFFGKSKVIDLLIKAGSDLNVVGYNSATALDHARNRGNSECEEILKKAGALSRKEL
ncbi:MAG: ankyrin repeat domain-containing protein [Spirochaetales bacterium]|nr:ankyrin repeat domain-containing protein [Spirochaetales bacterium]